MKTSHLYIFSWLLTLTPLHIQAKFEITERASWVSENAVSKKNEHADHYSSSFLLLDQQTRVEDQGQSDYTRLVSQVNNAHGLTELGEISISFDPSYQRLQVHQVNIIRNSQVINVLDQNEFEVIRQESELNQGIYNGKETALLLIKDLQINDILDYDYTVIGKNPIFENHIFDEFAIEWVLPVVDLYISFSVPKHKEIEFQTQSDPVKPKKTQTSDRITYQWHIQNVPALDYQGNYPEWYEVRKFLELSEFKNWQQVAQWASDVFAVETQLNQEMIATINSWDLEGKDLLFKTSKALSYVQDEIRYLGIEIGINSHKPRPPNETFASKYGDCKDKTMLLHAILKHMGINSKPALVSTELNNSIIDRLPSPGLFNHVILNLQLAGVEYWIDPTTTHQGSELSKLGMSDFGYGLVVDKLTKDLSQIKRLNTQVDRKKTTETIDISKNEDSVQLSIDTEFEGRFAEYWRSNLATNPINQVQKQFESFTNQMYGLAESSKDLKVMDHNYMNQLNISEMYTLNDPWKQSKSYEYMELFANTILTHVEPPSRINRDTPIGLVHPVDIEHQFIVNDPTEEIDTFAQSIEITTDQISYRKTITKEDKKILVHHQFKTLSDHTKTDDLAEYYQAINKIKKHLSVIIGLPVNKKTRIKESNDRLKSALQKMLKEKKG